MTNAMPVILFLCVGIVAIAIYNCLELYFNFKKSMADSNKTELNELKKKVDALSIRATFKA